MGLFGKEKKQPSIERPKLAELPKLPALPNMPTQQSNKVSKDKIHQLPSIPSSSFGDKFSQDSIKEAVSGKRGEEDYANDFDYPNENEIGQMMRNPLQHPAMEELDEEIEAEELGMPKPRHMNSTRRRASMEAEPIFIRIDKFEHAMDVFQEAKDKITDIEHLLMDIKKTREQEEKELKSWEDNVLSLKKDIERTDRDIFSKV